MKLSSSLRLLAAVAVVALPSLVLADTITFSVPTINLTESGSPQSGYFDVTMSVSADGNTDETNGGGLNTNGTETVNGTQVEIQSTLATLFTSSDDQTQANSPAGGPATYIFAPSDSSDDPSFNGSNTTFSANGTQTFPSNDVYLADAASGAGVSVSGTPVGIFRVAYTIPGGFLGSLPLTIATDSAQAFTPAWLDAGFNGATPLLVNGAINVTPEPSSVVLLVLGAIGLFGIRRLRSR